MKNLFIKHLFTVKNYFSNHKEKYLGNKIRNQRRNKNIFLSLNIRNFRNILKILIFEYF